jgi:hypothetical protein
MRLIRAPNTSLLPPAAAAAVALVALVVLLGFLPALAAKASTPPASCDRGARSIGELLTEVTPKELAGPLEAQILSSYALFRRPQQLGDQPPALSRANEQVGFQLGGYFPGYVRLLAALPDGAHYFAVPGFLREQSIPPAHCLPPSERSLRAKLVEEQRKQASVPVYCIVESGPHPSHEGEGRCEPFAGVEEGLGVFASGFSERPVVDLVPDGVASVRIDYRTGSPILASVSENALLFTPAKARTQAFERVLKALAREGPITPSVGGKPPTKAQRRRRVKDVEKRLDEALAQATPSRIEWLSASGTLLRAISPPPRHTGSSSTIEVLSTTFGA